MVRIILTRCTTKQRVVINSKSILVTGATKYVGGRLVPLFLESGYRVKAMARSLAKLKYRSWAQDPRVELAEKRAGILEMSCGGYAGGWTV